MKNAKAVLAMTGLFAVALPVSTSASAEIKVPCQYLIDGVERLEWDTRQGKENRLMFSVSMQSGEGMTGRCNPDYGHADSCARVSWIAKVSTKRPLVGWGFPDRAQAVYHFDGGIKPDDFCEIDDS